MRAIINNKIRALLLALCFGQAVPMVQLRNDTSHNPFRPHSGVRPLLSFQYNFTSNVRDSSPNRMEYLPKEIIIL